MKGTRSFTLLELLIVVIVVGVLAGLAIPTYMKTVESAKARIAIANLELIRKGEKMYRLDNPTYARCPTVVDINSDLNLDIEEIHYTYAVPNADATTFLARATRTSDTTVTITIDQDGNWGGTSPFVP